MNLPRPENISLEAFLAWEQLQADRYEWIDGTVIRCAGGSDEHAAIAANLIAAFHAAAGAGPCFVRGSDRKLVPRDAHGRDLGSFYADLFISCAPEDRRGGAAHFPTIVVEVLSQHGGSEFTRKREAYLRSARLTDYYIIDSTRRYVFRYSRPERAEDRGRIFTAEYHRGPVPVPALGLRIAFEQLYAGTLVPSILNPIGVDEEQEEITHD
jgi:Uma2 family endonuclease